MAAHDFEHWQEADTAEEAFALAQADARYEYGHNPYNGTISTVDDFKMIPLEEGETHEQWKMRMLEHPAVQKWECCACRTDPENPRLFIFTGWAAC